jgi:hypothetical protein
VEDGQEDGTKESHAVGVEDGVGGFQLASIASTNEARASARTCAAGGDWTGRCPIGDGEKVIGAASSWPLVRFLAPEGGGRGGGPAGQFGKALEGPGRHHDGGLEEDDLAGAGDDVRLKQGDLRATCSWSRGCGAGGARAAPSPSREHAAPPVACSNR